MQVEHHDLPHEFPEYVQSIEALRGSNERFSRLFSEYEALTGNVEELETKDIPVDDVTFENLKKQRAKLKDELYAMLVAHGK